MRQLTAAALLDAWERCLPLGPAARALELLAAAEPDTPPAALGALSLGERDARLLDLYERAFGGRLVGVIACPACGARLEVGVTADQVRAPRGSGPAAGPLSLTVDGYELSFRLPNGLDLVALAPLADLAAARRALLARCLVGAWRGDEEVDAAELPDEVAVAVAGRMQAHDPQAEIRLAVTCADCGHRWHATVDVGQFVWAQVDAWAHRLAAEVHALAAAYGWRESDVLSLSPWRRQLYLELAAG